MRLTPGAANLLVAAIGRAERSGRLTRLLDMRVAVQSSMPTDGKKKNQAVDAFNDLVGKLKR